jgi:flagellar basal-body rod modification protein FlgD
MTSPVSEVMPQLWSAATDGATSPTPSTTSSDDVDLGGIDSNSFLKLLVAQLTHQNPMNPTDSSTYIAEEAQFSMVQALNTVAKQNAEILRSQQMQEATTFIGKQVTYVGPDGVAGSGVVASASPGDSAGAVVRVGSQQIPVSSITAVLNAGD